MKKAFLLLALVWIAIHAAGQTAQRLLFTAVNASQNTGQDYQSWLNDDLNDLVANAWENNFKWVDVTLTFSEPSLVTSIKLYDYEGVFSENPAYIYAVKDGKKIYLGRFIGPTYKTFIDLNFNFSVIADAILVHKYSNNIPQKIQAFGFPLTQSPAALPEQRIPINTIVPSENTGQDYSSWLTDNLDSLVPNAWENNFKWVDVKLSFDQPALVQRLSFYDFEGVFTDKPASIYLQKGETKTFIGTFEGPGYNSFADLVLPGQQLADAVIIHKYSNNIPQKVRVFGQPAFPDPIDTLVKGDGRLAIKKITWDERTQMNFLPWLSDNTDSLVQGAWNAINFTYTDVQVDLEQESKIGRLSFFDWEGVFNEHPVSIYARTIRGNVFLGTFDGSSYNRFTDLVLTDSVQTSAIILHKYGNDVPQKVRIYGRVADGVNTPGGQAIVQKIPIEGRRWFQLNNCSNGLQGLSDGDTLTRVETGWGKILNNYEAWYPIEKGEHIDLSSVKFFDGEGSLGPYPMTLYAVNNNNEKIKLAVFSGSRYNEWVGPVPDSDKPLADRFHLDSTVHDIRYLVLDCWYGYPNEIALYGTYAKDSIPWPVVPKPTTTFTDMMGVNAFEWDFESPYDPYNIDETRMQAMNNFSAVRHYIDWEKLESHEGSYTYSPVHSGGWNYDTIYQRSQQSGIDILACVKTVPSWMLATWPEDMRDAENVPVKYGAEFSNPASYVSQAKLVFQYAARYGNNKLVDPSLLSVNSNPRWTNDEINTLKTGLGLVHFIECDNERDKWWKGRKAYQTAFEYAANLSAFYDGHKNTLGAGVGVKNADPTMKVVMGGLAAANPEYLRGMIEWCRMNRGYNPDGTVNLCWDVINYHYYSNDTRSSQTGWPTRGAAPELSGADSIANEFLQMAARYASGMPVWITECGYDLNQGSTYKAIPIGSKTEYQTQADWILRTALMYARTGISRTFFYQAYDDNFQSPVQFSSMGLLGPDKKRRPAADYLVQAGKLLKGYHYSETISTKPLADRYEKNGQPVFVLMVPAESGQTISYDLEAGAYDSAWLYYPVPGADTMRREKRALVAGILHVEVTETPLFVVPLARQASISSSENMLMTSLQPEANPLAVSNEVLLYPNPTTGKVQVMINAAIKGPMEISVIQQSTGQVVRSISFSNILKGTQAVTDLKTLPAGMYVFRFTTSQVCFIKRITLLR